MSVSTEQRTAVAVIGMACRLPGAASVDEFWRNLRGGVESVRRLERDELIEAGVSPGDLLNPRHVPAGALIDDVELFDAGFFGFTSREAELMDPQHRIFLECASQGLEDAGYDPARYDGAISIFGGGIFNSYVTRHLVPGGVFDDRAGVLQTVLANEKDYMVARVAYKLNLRGVACNVQTGCSTSLVAVHLACQSLLNYESDMALAGGIAIDLARAGGYHYHEGSVYSPDGHCRAFDADARGTVFGNGAGIVVLKRLEDAIADGDTIRAIVLGTAVNNDGSLKVGFTAPSLTGQSRVIIEALGDAGVPPESIGYVEAHGTGTALGDPIEIQAMVKAFGEAPAGTPRCPVGSVKSNIGHLDAAAGVAGFIKTVLALQHGVIPPTLHFRRPNPQLEIERSRFFIAGEAIPWTTGASPGAPRRAGVSSFGMGGTNAHVVLEEAPRAVAPPSPSRPAQVLLLSARSAAALDAATERLAAHLEGDEQASLPDVAFTLQVGRAVFAHRRSVVCRDAADAVAALRTRALQSTHPFDGAAPRVAFMFPGQGAQYPGMGRRLYGAEPAFRRAFDECAAILSREIDLPAFVRGDEVSPEQLARTEHAQPVLFALEYSLAQLWRHWGVEPEALIGHSLGEYVAACLAGVFSLEDALRLVFARARLMQAMPQGSMTAVPLPPERLELHDGVELAGANAPSISVVAGRTEDVAAFEERMRGRGIECRRLHTSHAFHSAAMDPVVGRFEELVSRVARHAPKIRLVSNVTGGWMTDEQATSAGYWARHLRQPVLFSRGLATLLGEGVNVLLEVGPGRALGTLARAHTTTAGISASLPGPQEPADEYGRLLEAIGQLWTRGVTPDWRRFWEGERRRRVPLPTYPFERARHWIDVDEDEVERRRARVRANEKNGDTNKWLYVRGWKQGAPAASLPRGAAECDYLVVSDDSFVAKGLVRRLESRVGPGRVVVATPGPGFNRVGERRFTIGPERAADYDRLLAAAAAGGRPLRIVHLGNAGPLGGDRASTLALGFYSIARLGGAIARGSLTGPVTVKAVTAHAEDVIGLEPIAPDRATVAPLCLVLSQEQPHVRCQHIDIAPELAGYGPGDDEALAAEVMADAGEVAVAIRGGRRWVPIVEVLKEEPRNEPAVRRDGHYLIIGGFGTIGFSLACYLVQTAGARLSLVGRRTLPPRPEWPAWVEAHPSDGRGVDLLRKADYLDRVGARYVAIAADAADAAQLRDAIERAEGAFGRIDGVIVAAGLMEESAFAPVGTLDPSTCDRHFAPKLDGLPALEAALGDRPLDFCVVTSSLSTLLGGVGYGAYAAANAYLDAFVHRHNRTAAVPWSVVNWDAWHPVGGELPATSLLARLAMTPGEGAAAFDRLLRYRALTHVYVSTADLPARADRWTNAEERPVEPAGAEPAPSADAPAAPAVEEMTPTERTIVEIWRQVLGIGYVDLHDGFLDLGGSSLTAIQVIDRIEATLGVRVTIEEFIFQTAAQLAALCDARRRAPAAPGPAPEAGKTGTGWARIRGMLRPRAADVDAVGR